VRPIEPGDRMLITITNIAYLAFTIDLCVVASRNLNSGSLGAALIFGFLFLLRLAYTFKSRNMKEVTESWLLNFRLATIVHQFILLLFFWVALSVLLLIQVVKEGFFQGLQNIAQESSLRALLASLLFIFVFISVMVYGVILYVHSRSMWSLDEIASLSLAAKLQARLNEDRDE